MGILDRIVNRSAHAAAQVATTTAAAGAPHAVQTVVRDAAAAMRAAGSGPSPHELVASLKQVKLVQIHITNLAADLRKAGAQLEQIAEAEGHAPALQFRPAYDRMERRLAELVADHDAKLLEHAKFSGNPSIVDQGTRDVIAMMQQASAADKVVALPSMPTGRTPLESRLDALLTDQPPMRRPAIDMTPQGRTPVEIGLPAPSNIAGLVDATPPSHLETIGRYEQLMGTTAGRPGVHLTPDARAPTALAPDNRSNLSSLVDSTRRPPSGASGPADVPQRQGPMSVLDRDLSQLGDIRTGDQRIDDALENLRRNPPKPGDGVGPQILVVDNMGSKTVQYEI